MNKFKATFATLLLPFVFFAALFAFLTTAPPPVHAFAGDYALEFDGVSDYVALGSASNLLGTDWQSTKTLTVWLRPESEPTMPITVGNVTERLIVGDFPIWFGIHHAYDANAGQARIVVWNNDSSDPLDPITGARISIPYILGEWVHIALVHNVTALTPNPNYNPDIHPPCLQYLATAGTLAAYRNGVFMGSVNSGRTACGHPGALGGIDLRIGGAIGGGANNPWERLFDGQIDEVTFWNTALTQQDIQNLMYRPLSGNEPGLRAYYQMSNGSGAVLADDSVNNFTGTLLDGVLNHLVAPPDGDTAAWITSGALAGPRNALAFDGNNDYVALNANTATIIGGGWASAKTAELWAYPTGSAPAVGSAAAGNIIFAGDNWGISQANLGSGDFLYIFNNDGSEQPLPIPYTVNEWVHLALVHDGTDLLAYRNGVLAGSSTSGSTSGDSNLFVGGRVSGQYFAGQLDELRLWSTARTPLQIQDNMARTLAHNEGGLAAYYRFDQENDGTVTTVYDTAVNSRHAAMTNMNPATAWVASTAFNTWIGSQSSDWANGANWSRYAAPAAADNAGLYNYPASNAPEISAGSFANSVLIASGTTLTVQSGGSLRADGLWFNQGTLVVNNGGVLQQEKAVDGSAPVRFFADGNYGPFTIDGNGFDLGATTITVRALENCTTGGPEQTVQRCIDIAPANSPTISNPGSTLTFSFLNSELSSNACNTLNAFHWDGSGWDELARDGSFGVEGRQCTTEPYELRVTGVTDFSPFMLTSATAPTAVSLQTFSVASTPGVALLLLIGSVFMLLTAVLVNGRRAD